MEPTGWTLPQLLHRLEHLTATVMNPGARQTPEASVKPTESENLYTGFLHTHTHPLPTPKNPQPLYSVRPHRRQPTRLPHPWDSPGKNTGVLQGKIDIIYACVQDLVFHYWADRDLSSWLENPRDVGAWWAAI